MSVILELTVWSGGQTLTREMSACGDNCFEGESRGQDNLMGGGDGEGEGRCFQGSDLKLSLERGVRINKESSGQHGGRP